MVNVRYAPAILVVMLLVTGCDRESRIDGPEPETIHDDGRVYTPAGLDDRGCMRYSVQITGGVAPAALYHQLRNGKFVVAHDGTDCTDGGFRLLIK